MRVRSLWTFERRTDDESTNWEMKRNGVGGLSILGDGVGGSVTYMNNACTGKAVRSRVYEVLKSMFVLSCPLPLDVPAVCTWQGCKLSSPSGGTRDGSFAGCNARSHGTSKFCRSLCFSRILNINHICR